MIASQDRTNQLRWYAHVVFLSMTLFAVSSDGRAQSPPQNEPMANCVLRGGTPEGCAAALGAARGGPATGNSSPAADCAQAETHWKAAVEINSLAVYQDHMARFPNCAFAILAQINIRRLQTRGSGSQENYCIQASTELHWAEPMRDIIKLRLELVNSQCESVQSKMRFLEYLLLVQTEVRDRCRTWRPPVPMPDVENAGADAERTAQAIRELQARDPHACADPRSKSNLTPVEVEVPDHVPDGSIGGL